MSGWTRRRSSGEIINATLLEVFLALVFVVFSLAVFEHRRALAAEKKSAGMISAEDSGRLGGALRATRDSLDSAKKEIDKIRARLFDSPYPPDCEPKVNPPWILTIELVGPGEMAIRAVRKVAGLQPAETAHVTLGEFRRRFASVAEIGKKQGCRYWALVRDTRGTSKADFKAAMAAINTVFRARGAYR